jgi:hypothetical protein
MVGNHIDKKSGYITKFPVNGNFAKFTSLLPAVRRTWSKADIAGNGSYWIRANMIVPPRGFRYDTGQCIGRGICNEDEVEALRVVSAGHCDWAGQKNESPPNAARTKRIRKSR